MHCKLALTICVVVPVAPAAILPSTVTPDLNRAAWLVSILALSNESLFNEAAPNTLTLPKKVADLSGLSTRVSLLFGASLMGNSVPVAPLGPVLGFVLMTNPLPPPVNN